MVNFPTQIPNCDSDSPALLDLFLLMLVFLIDAFPSIGKFRSCFHWLSIKFTMGCSISSHNLWLILCWLGVFVIIWEMFHGRISLNLVLLLLLVNFVSWFRLELMYIPHRKYQLKPHSSPLFSAPCAATIGHRNHFFFLYQNDKSSDCKVQIG